MRSNDVVFGFSNDVFTFTLFQQLMLNELRVAHPKLELGSYFHHAGSMHIYDRHYKMLDIDFDADVPEHDKRYLLKPDVTLKTIKEKELYLPIADMSKEDLSTVVNLIERELFI
jgi:thymidylate synthase